MYTGRTAARQRGCMKGPPAAEPHNHLARALSPSGETSRGQRHVSRHELRRRGPPASPRGGPAEGAGLERRRSSLAEFLGEA